MDGCGGESFEFPEVIRTVREILIGKVHSPFKLHDIMENPDGSITLYFALGLQDAVFEAMRVHFQPLHLNIDPEVFRGAI